MTWSWLTMVDQAACNDGNRFDSTCCKTKGINASGCDRHWDDCVFQGQPCQTRKHCETTINLLTLVLTCVETYLWIQWVRHNNQHEKTGMITRRTYLESKKMIFLYWFYKPVQKSLCMQSYFVRSLLFKERTKYDCIHMGVLVSSLGWSSKREPHNRPLLWSDFMSLLWRDIKSPHKRPQLWSDFMSLHKRDIKSLHKREYYWVLLLENSINIRVYWAILFPFCKGR